MARQERVIGVEVLPSDFSVIDYAQEAAAFNQDCPSDWEFSQEPPSGLEEQPNLDKPVMLVGREFKRRLSRRPDDAGFKMLGRRQVKILVGFNQKTGTFEVLRFQPSIQAQEQDLLTEKLGSEAEKSIDPAFCPKIIRTVRKRGASRLIIWNEAEAVRQRGGDPDFKLGGIVGDRGSGSYWGPPDEDHPQIER